MTRKNKIIHFSLLARPALRSPGPSRAPSTHAIDATVAAMAYRQSRSNLDDDARRSVYATTHAIDATKPPRRVRQFDN